jgi:thiosulfate dehydrogenase [quinone] large subunit
MNKTVVAVLRVFLGFIFLWAFVDKLIGLGFATPSSSAWIHGGSPTAGFLSMATKGPFTLFFHSLAGNPLIDIVFMAGLLFVGITLLVNRMVRWGSIAGLLMVLLMYIAVLPPANNPVLDEHLIYAVIFIGLIIQSSASPQRL